MRAALLTLGVASASANVVEKWVNITSYRVTPKNYKVEPPQSLRRGLRTARILPRSRARSRAERRHSAADRLGRRRLGHVELLPLALPHLLPHPCHGLR